MPPYGDKFRVGEVLLVHFRDKPGFFARVEDIKPDRKKDWWQLTFLVLAVPLQQMTWILDDDQVRGSDFTMGGEPIRLERVKAPEKFPEQVASPEDEEKADEPDADPQEDGGKVISMFDEE